jgi:hypothetical protein
LVWPDDDPPKGDEAALLCCPPLPGAAPTYSSGSARDGKVFLKEANPPSTNFLNRVAEGVPMGPSSKRLIVSLMIISRWTLNSSACLFASMCPAPTRKAISTGAVNNGNGVCGAAGKRARNRDNHLIAPSCPPSRV